MEMELMNRVQFIYELDLARMELDALSVEYENNCTKFKLVRGDKDLLVKRVAYFRKIGGSISDYERLTQFNRTTSINQYLTHCIYPYKGKFHPQMVRAFLNMIHAKKGDTILDPFVGSGTTALEAQLLGINCVGVDISPVCVYVAKVKTQSIDVLSEIKEVKNKIMDSWQKLRDAINSIEDEKVRNFFLVAELYSHSDVSRRRRNFAKSFSKNVEKMVQSVEDYERAVKELNIETGSVRIEEGNSKELKLDDNSIDGIITSPPYSIALDYIKNDAHAFDALGIDAKKIRDNCIGVRGSNPTEKIKLYNYDMEQSIREMHRVLKSGKFCVIVVGDATYRGEKIKTTDYILECATNAGFKLIKNINKVIFGAHNIMQKENILIFQK